MTHDSLLLEDLSATHRLGERLGALLQPGDFIGLIGELGAGKTTLVRAVARGAGITEEVTSPTFSILNRYRGKVLTLFHADLYRLESRDELYATGYFDLEQGAILVEWIDRIPNSAPPHRLELRLAIEEGERRRLQLDAFGNRAEALLRALLP